MKEKITAFLNNFLERHAYMVALIKKEFLLIWRDPQSRMIIFIPPLLQLFVFAHAMTMEIKNLDMVVLDRAKTRESRELISGFEHSRWFRKIVYAQNETQLKNIIDLGHVQLGLEINSDFSKNLKARKPTSVQIIVDGRQTNSAAIGGAYASQIVSDFGAANFPYVEKGRGATVEIRNRNWFNPNLLYLWFTLSFLISMLSVIVTLVLTALSVARERELGTFDQLLVSPLSSNEILIGKTVPAMAIALSLTCFMLAVSMIFFKLPFIGNPLLFFLSIFIALFAVTGVGLFVSSICKTQQQAILGVFTFQTPAILLSGFISPIKDMPVLLQYLTYLNPLRFHVATARGLILKGITGAEILHNLIPLALIAVITLSLAGWMFKRKLD